MTESQTTFRPARVLLISASVGAGHNSAAHALLEGLSQSTVPMEVELIDSLQLAPWWFRQYYSGGFATVVSRMPWAYGLGFAITDHPQGPKRSLEERVRLWRERRIMKPLSHYIESWRPDLVVSTHFLAPPIVNYLQRTGRIHTRQFVTVTDIRVHRFWHARGVDRWFVPTEVSAEPLQRWGIDPDTITVSGMPIHPKWHQPCDRAKILAEWTLPAGRPIVLLTGGTEFTCGPVIKIARRILVTCPQAHLAVLGGRNKSLLADLGALAAETPHLTPVAFTDRSHELVDVADVMITKAGGITTAECLARGTGMILLKPVPGQESGNAEYLAKRGAAILTRKTDDVIGQLSRLLSQPAALAKLGESARALARPGTQTITEAIEETCRTVSACDTA